MLYSKAWHALYSFRFCHTAVLDFSGIMKPHKPLLGVSPAVNSLISVCYYVIVMDHQIACEINNEKKQVQNGS